MKTTTAITTIKRNVQLQEWTERIKEQQESGMTIKAYCAQNGINLKTYYYHLRKVREQCLESEPAIVPVAAPRSTSDIRIEKNSMMQLAFAILITKASFTKKERLLGRW